MYICGMEKKIKELEQGIYDLTKQLAELKDKPFVTAKAIFFPYKHEDELKPKFEVGKWYKLTSDCGTLKKDMVFMYVRHQDDNSKYPFVIVNHQMFGELSDGGGNYLAPNEDQLIEATNEEVQTALIKEAKKRGFKEGVMFKSAFMGNKYQVAGFQIDSNCLHCKGNSGCIFDGDTGKWATIIDTPLMINGEKVDYIKSTKTIRVGTAEFDSYEFQDLLVSLDEFNNGRSNRTIKLIILDSGEFFTLEELKQIVDKIK